MRFTASSPTTLALTGALALLVALPAAAQDKRKKDRRFPSIAKVTKEIERLRRAKKPSIAHDHYTSGTLENAAELPRRGLGYQITSPARKTKFGTDEMVFGLMELGARMHDLHKSKGVFIVGDISREKGGKLEPHISHQMGLDVDLGLYICSKRGKPRGNRMVTFGKEGKSKDGSLYFDAARNWDLVTGMLESSHFGEISAILLADWLKAKMLEHARKQLERTRDPKEKKRLESHIRAAEKLIRQPTSSPHDNHFHLCLKQPAEDKQD